MRIWEREVEIAASWVSGSVTVFQLNLLHKTVVRIKAGRAGKSGSTLSTWKEEWAINADGWAPRAEVGG